MDGANTNDAEVEAKTNGPGKARSETSYPYFGLSKVIEIVQAVRKAGGNEAAPAVDVLKELNITKTDRLWAYGIPAATYFGLVERIGRGDDARVKLTDLGLKIVLPGTQEEEKATKIAALRTPELYAKLLEQFAGHPVPSKDVLRRLLERDYKIVESMAGSAADAFLDSLTVADVVSSANTISLSGDPMSGRDEKKKLREDVPPAKPGMQSLLVPETFIVYKCKISKGRVIEIPLPPDFKKADVDRLHAFLQTQVDDEDIGAATT